MGDITVPKHLRSEMRDTRTKEYKIACIRDHINKNPGKVIKMADFMEVGGTTASIYIKDLMRAGRVIRHKVHNGQRGHSYSYVWIDRPNVGVSSSNNGSVKTKSLEFEPWPLDSQDGYASMSKNIDHYLIENVESLDGIEIRGIIKYKKHVRDEYDRVKKSRDAILEARDKEGDDE